MCLEWLSPDLDFGEWVPNNEFVIRMIVFLGEFNEMVRWKSEWFIP